MVDRNINVISLSRVRALRAAERAVKGAHEQAARFPGPVSYHMHGEALKHLRRLRAEAGIIDPPPDPSTPPCDRLKP